jgi:prevent-host-death family protein
MRAEVSVRELRQNLSKYLRRVKKGTSLRVLERGRPAALLTPLAPPVGTLDRLVAAGKAVPARLDLLSLGPPPKRRRRVSPSRALKEQREERL